MTQTTFTVVTARSSRGVIMEGLKIAIQANKPLKKLSSHQPLLESCTMFPPRDYPEQDAAEAARKHLQDAESVTVRTVLDRLDSKKPVSPAMISKAVNNLFTADTLEGEEPKTSTPIPSANPVGRLNHLLRNR